MQPFETRAELFRIRSAHIRDYFIGIAFGVLAILIATYWLKKNVWYERFVGMVPKSNDPTGYWISVVTMYVSGVGAIIYCVYRLLTLPMY